MLLKNLLQSLITKAGIGADDETVKAVLENAEIAKIDVPDDTANKIDGALMNLAAAENNAELRKKLIQHGRVEAFNGMDSEIEGTMKDLGIDQATMDKILAEKSTPKRARLLATEVQRIAKETGTKGTEEAEALKTKVNDLNQRIGTMKAAHDKAVNELKEQYENRINQIGVQTDLTGFNYIFPDGTPQHIILAAAQTAVNTRLAAKGVKIVTTEAGLKKIVKAEDGTDYYDEANKPVSYHDFLAKALAEDKLLKGNETRKTGEGQHDPPPTPPDPKVDQQRLQQVSSDLDNLEAQLKKSGT